MKAKGKTGDCKVSKFEAWQALLISLLGVSLFIRFFYVSFEETIWDMENVAVIFLSRALAIPYGFIVSLLARFKGKWLIIFSVAIGVVSALGSMIMMYNGV